MTSGCPTVEYLLYAISHYDLIHVIEWKSHIVISGISGPSFLCCVSLVSSRPTVHRSWLSTACALDRCASFRSRLGGNTDHPPISPPNIVATHSQRGRCDADRTKRHEHAAPPRRRATIVNSLGRFRTGYFLCRPWWTGPISIRLRPAAGSPGHDTRKGLSGSGWAAQEETPLWLDSGDAAGDKSGALR